VCRSNAQYTEQASPRSSLNLWEISESEPDLPPSLSQLAISAPFPAPEITAMALLFRYLRGYWPLVALALLLAAINQIFSLLDPLIFRHVIDDYALKFKDYTNGEFFRGVVVLLGMAVGVAFVSRVAKNFQEY
jgi:ABC-type bacteriocin/lantibiotic exporter with double-glycine peptidase domain